MSRRQPRRRRRGFVLITIAVTAVVSVSPELRVHALTLLEVIFNFLH